MTETERELLLKLAAAVIQLSNGFTIPSTIVEIEALQQELLKTDERDVTGV
jgi:hypothetical protein